MVSIPVDPGKPMLHYLPYSIVGFCYGSKNYERIKEAIRTVLPIGIGISLAATALFMAFPHRLLGLFSPGSEMLVIGIPALRIICITFGFASVTMILGYAMAGLGNGWINMLGTALRQLIIFVPLAYLFASYFGIEKSGIPCGSRKQRQWAMP